MSHVDGAARRDGKGLLPRMIASVSESFRPAIVAPTFNNARTLPTVLHAWTVTRLPVIVVNDGCTDGTASVIKDWLATSTIDGPERYVVTHRSKPRQGAGDSHGFDRAPASWASRTR